VAAVVIAIDLAGRPIYLAIVAAGIAPAGGRSRVGSSALARRVTVEGARGLAKKLFDAARPARLYGGS